MADMSEETKKVCHMCNQFTVYPVQNERHSSLNCSRHLAEVVQLNVDTN